MNNDKFLNEINRDLKMSKKEMKDRSEDIIRELNDYKKLLDDEMERSNERKKNSFSAESDKYFSKIVKKDSDTFGILDFENMDDEGYEIIESLASNDPTFALNFLERRKQEIPSNKYEMLKTNILKKMNIM